MKKRFTQFKEWFGKEFLSLSMTGNELPQLNGIRTSVHIPFFIRLQYLFINELEIFSIYQKRTDQNRIEKRLGITLFMFSDIFKRIPIFVRLINLFTNSKFNKKMKDLKEKSVELHLLAKGLLERATTLQASAESVMMACKDIEQEIVALEQKEAVSPSEAGDPKINETLKDKSEQQEESVQKDAIETEEDRKEQEPVPIFEEPIDSEEYKNSMTEKESFDIDPPTHPEVPIEGPTTKEEEKEKPE